MYPRVIPGILTINIVASVFREKRPRTRVNHTSVPRKPTQSDYHKVRSYRQERRYWRSRGSLRFLYAKSLLLSWFRSIFTVVASFRFSSLCVSSKTATIALRTIENGYWPSRWILTPAFYDILRAKRPCVAGEILATFSAFKAALQCHFPLAPKIKPTILFRLFSTRLIFSLPLRIGISTSRCVTYLEISSHSTASKLLKRALLHINSFVCTFVVLRSFCDASRRSTNLFLVQIVCQRLLSKSTEIIGISSFTSCGVPRCPTSMPLFHLSVPRPCTSVSLSIVQLRRSEELANNVDHRRSDEITARRKQHPCSRVLQRPPRNKKRGAAAGTPWRIARSFRRERRHCLTVGAILTVSIAIVEKSQGGSGMKSFTARTRLVD
ncbi:uncharacterized protein LOC122569570 [Bombus pyrosoma]|uniref:uncharacterized protein LOC122569570 n=1 Tax=Bombus pyrosoma TaxID=396416 RepID=UPI001CB92EEB|nr:uncharacterized protein LOC122569570 [Bombus pyrosoma]